MYKYNFAHQKKKLQGYQACKVTFGTGGLGFLPVLYPPPPSSIVAIHRIQPRFYDFEEIDAE